MAIFQIKLIKKKNIILSISEFEVNKGKIKKRWNKMRTKIEKEVGTKGLEVKR